MVRVMFLRFLYWLDSFSSFNEEDYVTCLVCKGNSVFCTYCTNSGIVRKNKQQENNK